jgi:hypothetical protein
MHLVHSAFNITITETFSQNALRHQQAADDSTARNMAYQSVCNKYSREIAAIQKYIPGWMPSPPPP